MSKGLFWVGQAEPCLRAFKGKSAVPHMWVSAHFAMGIDAAQLKTAIKGPQAVHVQRAIFAQDMT